MSWRNKPIEAYVEGAEHKNLTPSHGAALLAFLGAAFVLRIRLLSQPAEETALSLKTVI